MKNKELAIELIEGSGIKPKRFIIKPGMTVLYKGKPVQVVDNGGPDNIVITGKNVGLLQTIEVSREDVSPVE